MPSFEEAQTSFVTVPCAHGTDLRWRKPRGRQHNANASAPHAVDSYKLLIRNFRAKPASASMRHLLAYATHRAVRLAPLQDGRAHTATRILITTHHSRLAYPPVQHVTCTAWKPSHTRRQAAQLQDVRLLHQTGIQLRLRAQSKNVAPPLPNASAPKQNKCCCCRAPWWCHAPCSTKHHRCRVTDAAAT